MNEIKPLEKESLMLNDVEDIVKVANTGKLHAEAQLMQFLKDSKVSICYPTLIQNQRLIICKGGGNNDWC